MSSFNSFSEMSSSSMSDETTRRREIDGLTEAAEQTKCNDLTIVTADEEDELTVDGRKIKIVPAWKWLLS